MNSPDSLDDQSLKKHRDEFDPVAVLRVIYRRRAIFIMVFLAVVMLGLATTQFKTPVNNYVTSIQIGSAYGNNEISGRNEVSGRLVEDTEGVVTRLERVVIPQLVSEWLQEEQKDAIPEVMVKAKKTAGIVLIMTAASEKEAERVSAFHKAIAQPIVDEHKALVMRQYDLFLANAEGKRAESKAAMEQLTTGLSKKKEHKLLLQRQLNRLISEIELHSAASAEPQEAISAENRAALYLLRAELPAMLERRDQMENSIIIALDLGIADIQEKLANASSSLEAAEKQIALLENELFSLRLTRIQALAADMPGEIGLTSKNILIMSILLGLLLAWFLVMFLEYLARFNIRR